MISISISINIFLNKLNSTINNFLCLFGLFGIIVTSNIDNQWAPLLVSIFRSSIIDDVRYEHTHMKYREKNDNVCMVIVM